MKNIKLTKDQQMTLVNANTIYHFLIRGRATPEQLHKWILVMNKKATLAEVLKAISVLVQSNIVTVNDRDYSRASAYLSKLFKSDDVFKSKIKKPSVHYFLNKDYDRNQG